MLPCLYLLAFIVVIIFFIVTVQCFSNSYLNSIFKKMFEIWMLETIVVYVYLPVLVQYWLIARGVFFDNFQIYTKTVANFRFISQER